MPESPNIPFRALKLILICSHTINNRALNNSTFTHDTKLARHSLPSISLFSLLSFAICSFAIGLSLCLSSPTAPALLALYSSLDNYASFPHQLQIIRSPDSYASFLIKPMPTLTAGLKHIMILVVTAFGNQSLYLLPVPH